MPRKALFCPAIAQGFFCAQHAPQTPKAKIETRKKRLMQTLTDLRGDYTRTSNREQGVRRKQKEWAVNFSTPYSLFPAFRATSMCAHYMSPWPVSSGARGDRIHSAQSSRLRHGAAPAARRWDRELG